MLKGVLYWLGVWPSRDGERSEEGRALLLAHSKHLPADEKNRKSIFPQRAKKNLSMMLQTPNRNIDFVVLCVSSTPQKQRPSVHESLSTLPTGGLSGSAGSFRLPNSVLRTLGTLCSHSKHDANSTRHVVKKISTTSVQHQPFWD